MSKKNQSIEARVAALEKAKTIFLSIIAAFAVVGITIDKIFWNLYEAVRLKAEQADTEVSKLRESLSIAESKIADVITESEKYRTEIAKEYCQLQRRCGDMSSIVSRAKQDAENALDVAGRIKSAVEDAATSAKEAKDAAKRSALVQNAVAEESARITDIFSQVDEKFRALESFLSTRIETKPSEKFEVKITANHAECTFVDGDSIPYSRVIGGFHATASVVVPRNAVCIVNCKGFSQHLKIQESIKGRVIIESEGNKVTTTYFR